jgi:(p)ppGpp synthase/HD superfamily hydrolase
MHAYAQTNVQLFNQLRCEGYSEEECELVRRTYEFAMLLFSGLFLPSGKGFIDHLVGTASILASLHTRIEIVAAGLIHAAYLHGDFGGARKGVSDAKRRKVRDAVDENVENYVHGYDRLLWGTREAIQTVDDHLADLGPIDCEVLLMRLANELEHELDLGNLYCNKSETEQKRHQRYMKCYGPKLVSMAERLGALPLATEIATASKNVASTRLPVVPCIRTKHRGAYVVTPTSYRQRLWVTLWTKTRDSFQICLGAPQRVRHKVSRVQYLFRTAFHRTGKA